LRGNTQQFDYHSFGWLTSLCCFPSTKANTEKSKMGGGNSKKEISPQSPTPDVQEDRPKAKEEMPIRVLLLGPGNCGKSAIFRQMKLLYGTGFSEEDRRDYVTTICENIVSNLKVLLCSINSNPETALEEQDLIAAAELIMNIDIGDMISLSQSQANAIDQLWKHPSLKLKFANRGKLFGMALNDSLQYWCENIHRLASTGYIPTDQDLIQARRLTLGITESHFTSKSGTPFSVVDVGAERSQRPKWLNQFSRCDVFIYIMALSQYDQTLFEDEKTNSLLESLDLWEFLMQNEIMKNKPCVLFFNKKDIFEEKLLQSKIPMTHLFPEYDGGEDVEKAVDFIKNLFWSKIPPSNHQVKLLVGSGLKKTDVMCVVDQSLDFFKLDPKGNTVLEKKEIKDPSISARVLVLGPRNGGKTTWINQMRIISGDSFSEKERMDQMVLIYRRLIANMQTLLKKLNLTAETNPMEENFQARMTTLLQVKVSAIEYSFPSEVADAIHILWSNQTVQETFEKRALLFNMSVDDSLRYWCNNIFRIARVGYLPSDEDMVISRSSTQKVKNVNFVTKKGKLILEDLGARTLEDMKPQLENYDAFVFVVSVSQYDQLSLEDQKTNSLVASLNHWESLMNDQELSGKDFVVFLNMKDLLIEKLIKYGVPLNSIFQDYAGGQNIHQATVFIKREFLVRTPAKRMNRIEYYFGSALKTSDAKHVAEMTLELIRGPFHFL
jgi:GTPase SAR1 family protein